MKNILEQIKENKKIHYGIIIVLALIISLPLIRLQMRGTHDGSLHVLRLIGMQNIFNIHEFPQFINPDYCRGFGYAINLFYPSLVTYGPMLLTLFSNTFSGALECYAAITLILSGIFMYQCAYEITKKRPLALFAAILYMLIPYKLEGIFTRFAIGEFSAYVFIPLVFKGLHNLFNDDGKKHYNLAIGAIGLMLSHTITTVYTAVFCLIYILFHIKKLKEKEILKKCVINGIFILTISAFFLIPLLEHKMTTNYGIFMPDVMATTPDFVADHTIGLWQLLKNKGEVPGVSFLIGLPIILLTILGVFTRKKKDQVYDTFYILSWLFAIISLMMCTRWFPWRIMPDFLATIQYPWRMLGFFGFFMSFICAVHAYQFIEMTYSEEFKKGIVTIGIIIFMIVLSIPMVTRYCKTDPRLQSNQEYEQNIIAQKRINHMQINREYLPYKAILLQNSYLYEREEDAVYILKGNAEIEYNEKENLNMKFTIKEAEKETELELPYLYYLGYQVTMEQQEEKTVLPTFESKNGFVSIKIPKELEEATITVQYAGTMIEKMSYAISLVALIGFVVYIQYSYVKEKKLGKEKMEH